MIPEATSCFQNGSQGLQVYGVEDDVMSSSLEMGSSVEMNSGAFIYSLSLLKDKVHQVQSLVSVIVSPHQGQTESVAIALASMGTLIQDIIVTASSMMFTCQQMVLGTTTVLNNNKTHDESNHSHDRGVSQPSNDGAIQAGNEDERAFFTGESSLDWYTDNYNNNYQNKNNSKNDNITIIDGNNKNNNNKKDVEERELSGFPPMNCDIIELEAADLLAKYTHYCQICGKGFKRDANLRMHMRAHGDEYKTNAALSNPMKNNNSNSVGGNDNYLRPPRKYSCPQEGCRWNKKHAKFQPLKSMICVKNHYKRTHCPKMYVCNRCNQKQFSVLSDLRTHEKHCGDLKWQCSCGTTFSRKDKLMGHVTLFIGHSPAGNSLMKQRKVDHHGQIAQIQLSKMRR